MSSNYPELERFLDVAWKEISNPSTKYGRLQMISDQSQINGRSWRQIGRACLEKARVFCHSDPVTDRWTPTVPIILLIDGRSRRQIGHACLKKTRFATTPSLVWTDGLSRLVRGCSRRQIGHKCLEKARVHYSILRVEGTNSNVQRTLI